MSLQFLLYLRHFYIFWKRKIIKLCNRFIGEEGSGGAVPQYEANTEDPTWIIDPVDGTTNFVHGYPQVSGLAT